MALMNKGKVIDMSAETEYEQKLRDPRWQRKRLEIFQRDKWTCQLCSRTDLELHVHHLHRTTENPWEEPDLHLLTVCRLCHEQQPSNPHGGFKPPKREYRTDAEWWQENSNSYDIGTQQELSMENVQGFTIGEAMNKLHQINKRIHDLRLASEGLSKKQRTKKPRQDKSPELRLLREILEEETDPEKKELIQAEIEELEEIEDEDDSWLPR
jgi:hypothetical protein